MTPIHPTATPQRGFPEDPTISVIRPFGLLFPNARLTVPNETALMRIVSNFRDLKLNELDATQRALIVQYLCFYAEKAVIEEGICFQPVPALNLNNSVGRGGLRGATKQDLEYHEPSERHAAKFSRKRKRAIQPSDLDSGEAEEASHRRINPSNAAEIDALLQRLEPIKFVLSRVLTVEHITFARSQFLTKLKCLTNSNGKRNKIPVITFTTTQAAEITNYFFTTILGNDLQQRVAALVEFWNSGAMEGMIHADESQAMEPASDENIPLPIQKFYHQFARAHQYDLDIETPYSILMRYKENLDLQDQWMTLTAKNSKYKNELIQYVDVPHAPHGLKKAIKRHICSTLNIANMKKFIRDMEGGGIRALVKYFGCGIIVFLPPGADKMLNALDQSKMPPVFKLFSKAMADLRPLCQVTETNIYDPIIAGRVLPKLPGSIEELSLEQMLRSLNTVATKKEETNEYIRRQRENLQGDEERSLMREPISQDRW